MTIFYVYFISTNNQAYCTLVVCYCYVTGGVWISFRISRSTGVCSPCHTYTVPVGNTKINFCTYVRPTNMVSLWSWRLRQRENLLLVCPGVREPVLKKFESHHWPNPCMRMSGWSYNWSTGWVFCSSLSFDQGCGASTQILGFGPSSEHLNVWLWL